jgi:ornithine carbamoyltransferase
MANIGHDYAASSMSAVAPVKDFLSILDLSTDDLHRLIHHAARLKGDHRLGRNAPTANALNGAHVALLFEKPSLRTRSTFEIAIHELGGEALHLPGEFADGTREPLKDVARNLERWVRALVIRTYAHDKAQTLAGAGTRLHVINALSDSEHPCQALADMLTMLEHWGDSQGRTVAYIGDGNNVATSLVHAAPQFGISVHVATPRAYALPAHVIEAGLRTARSGAQIRTFSDPREAVVGADAVYTDVWTSMGREDEAEVRRREFQPYQVNGHLMSMARHRALFMHCLPAHRGEEVTGDVFDGPASVVFDQAENRLHTQKALLLKLLS